MAGDGAGSCVDHLRGKMKIVAHPCDQNPQTQMQVASACLAPSPLNGERAGVRTSNTQQKRTKGTKVFVSFVRFCAKTARFGQITPHPQSLSPLRGEGSRNECLAIAIALVAHL
jgi:hypothetical protein